MTDQGLATLHLIATAFMTGLIWFVQVVHYPLFARVGREGFTEYEKRHTLLTTRVVAPAMLIEASAALWLLAREPLGPLPLAGAALLMAIWLSTALLQVPCHARLSERFDERDASRLVRTNWIRTLAWSARVVIAALMI